MSSSPCLLAERQGAVVVLRFNRAQRLNPLTIDLQQQLMGQLGQLRHDSSVRALLLTGAGKAFCVGADLDSMKAQEGISLGEQTASLMQALSNPLIEALCSLPFPVVSAVNGPCAGAGVGLALAADVVVAARSAYFYLPFMPRLGIVPDLGSTWFLQRFVGRARAIGLSLLGERLSGEQAAQWGLVWACVADAELQDQALAVAQRLARLPVHAVTEIRRAYDSADASSLSQQLRYETGRQRELIDRPEFAEGVRAFLEKRDPVF